MALSTETLDTMRSIAVTSARREDGLPIYPPFPSAILRRATVAMARVLAMDGLGAQLIQTLQEYERIGHFVHPRTPGFLLVMLDVYEAAQAAPHLQRRGVQRDSSESDDDQSSDNQSEEKDPTSCHVDLAKKLGEHFLMSPRYFLNEAD